MQRFTRYRRYLIYLGVFVVGFGTGIQWKSWQTHTELVVVNATGQDIVSLTVQMPSETVDTGPLEKGDARFFMLKPQITGSWSPRQYGTLKDGSPVGSMAMGGGVRPPKRITRLRYTFLPKGDVYTHLSTTSVR
jgi:hypothetical protein